MLVVFEQVNGKPVAVNPALVQTCEEIAAGTCVMHMAGLVGVPMPGALTGQVNLQVLGAYQVKGTLTEVLTRLDEVPTWLRRAPQFPLDGSVTELPCAVTGSPSGHA